MNNLGIVNIGRLNWDEAMELMTMMMDDGWEIIAIKVQPDGVWAFAQERILEWLDERVW